MNIERKSLIFNAFALGGAGRGLRWANVVVYYLYTGLMGLTTALFQLLPQISVMDRGTVFQ